MTLLRGEMVRTLFKRIVEFLVLFVAAFGSLSIVILTGLKISLGGFIIVFVIANIAGNVQAFIRNKNN